jgi:hypothetical protein
MLCSLGWDTALRFVRLVRKRLVWGGHMASMHPCVPMAMAIAAVCCTCLQLQPCLSAVRIDGSTFGLVPCLTIHI